MQAATHVQPSAHSAWVNRSVVNHIQLKCFRETAMRLSSAVFLQNYSASVVGCASDIFAGLYCGVSAVDQYCVVCQQYCIVNYSR